MSLTLRTPVYPWSTTSPLVGSTTLAGPFFGPLIQQLQTQADTGGVLTLEQYQSLQELPGLLPDTRNGQVYRRGLTSALEMAEAEGFKVSENLVSVMGVIEANFGDQLVADLPPEKQAVAERLRDQFNIAPPSMRSSAAMLFSPDGAAGFRYRHGREETAVTRILRGADGSLDQSPLPPLPRYFYVAGHNVKRSDDPSVSKILRRVFGMPVTIRQILECFSADQEGASMPFVVDSLHIDTHGDGGISFQGIFMTPTGEFAGNFHTIIDPRPARDKGEYWICRADNFHIEPGCREKGLGTYLLRKFLKLLFDFGVDALETQARTNGRYFYPSVGFSPINRQIFDETKRQFLDHLEKRGSLTPERRIEITGAKNLWEITDYAIGEDKVGKVFMAKLFARPLQLRFWLRPDYEGWLRVLGDKHPPEWRHLQAETQNELVRHFSQFEWMLKEALLSDEKEANLLAERVLNWSTHVSHYLARHRRSGVLEEMGEEEKATMRMIADVFHMIADHASDSVRYYFQRCLQSRRGDLPEVLEAIRASGIEVKS